MTDIEDLARLFGSKLDCGSGDYHEGHGPVCFSPAHDHAMWRDAGYCEFTFFLAQAALDSDLVTPTRRLRKVLDDEPLIVGGIRNDMERSPGKRGGVLRHEPGTRGWGHSGCPGDNLVSWADELWDLLPPEPKHTCDTCQDTGRVDWEPGAIRNTEEPDQPCPDCAREDDGLTDDERRALAREYEQTYGKKLSVEEIRKLREESLRILGSRRVEKLIANPPPGRLEEAERALDQIEFWASESTKGITQEEADYFRTLGDRELPEVRRLKDMENDD